MVPLALTSGSVEGRCFRERVETHIPLVKRRELKGEAIHLHTVVGKAFPPASTWLSIPCCALLRGTKDFRGELPHTHFRCSTRGEGYVETSDFTRCVEDFCCSSRPCEDGDQPF